MLARRAAKLGRPGTYVPDMMGSVAYLNIEQLSATAQPPWVRVYSGSVAGVKFFPRMGAPP
jgi:hypothetical protein